MAFTINKDYLIRPESHFAIDVPVPAEGTKVTLVSGFPAAGGRDMGEMVTAPKVKKLGGIQEIKVVNSATPIDQFITDPGAEMTVVVNRYTAENVRLAWNTSIRMMADGSAQVGIGSRTSFTGHPVFVSFQSTPGSGLWFYIMFYDAVMTAEIEVDLAPDNAVGMQYTFKARPIDGRSTDFSLGEHNLPGAFVV